MGGFPLGDLYHWFPKEYERWKAQENAEHDRISHWLNTGCDSIFTTLEGLSDSDIPIQFKLSQNYPNPFNSTTQICYSIPHSGYISLKVYNLLGKDVITLFAGFKQAGDYYATFDGKSLAGGVYFYQLNATDYIETKKLLLLK